MSEQVYRDLQRRADRICSLILNSECPDADIAVERSLLRGRVADNYPDVLELYDLIIESRFERLWEQFRV